MTTNIKLGANRMTTNIILNEIAESMTLHKELALAISELEDIAEDRASLNAQANAIFERLQDAHGCNRSAIKAAMKYVQLGDSQRENWDWTYHQTRAALGQPVQPDLFDTALINQINAENAEKVTDAITH